MLNENVNVENEAVEEKEHTCSCDGECSGECTCDGGCHCCSCDDETDTNVIEFNLSNGEQYLIHDEDVDWEDMNNNLEGVVNNINSIRRMIFDLVSTKDNELISHVINTLSEFANAFGGVKMDYSNMRDDISEYETALLMCFDTLTFTITMVDRLMLHNTMNECFGNVLGELQQFNPETILDDAIEGVEAYSANDIVGENLPDDTASEY